MHATPFAPFARRSGLTASLLFIATCALSFGAWAQTPPPSAPPSLPVEFTMKLATVAPDQTPWSELLKRYQKGVEAKSQGRIDVKVFLGGTLGDENEAALKCKRGQIQAVGASTGALASQVPELNVVELPFLFRTEKEADTVIDEVITPAMDEIFQQYGLVLGFWGENGFRQIGSSPKAVRSPADLEGMKVRSQESLVHLETWKALGASPVPIPTTEVPSALQAGTVDGFDQATLYAVAANWYKKVKYYTISNHIYQPAIITFNKAWFDGLPPDLQKIVIDEGRTLQVKGRAAVRSIGPDLLKIVENEGVQIVQLSDAERDVFENKTRGVRAILRKKQGAVTSGLLDKVEARLSALRGGK